MNIVERPIVVKVGGSCMADACSIIRVVSMIQSNPDWRFIIPSAPGNNDQYPNSDQRVTNLFAKAYAGKNGVERRNAMDLIKTRFCSIGNSLGVSEVEEDLNGVFRTIEGMRDEYGGGDIGLCFSKSRGEWEMGRILAKYWGATFVDAAEVIRIKNTNQLNPSSYSLVRDRLTNVSGRIVIPGFYGLDETGQIAIFDSGGSDVSGAIVARGVNARLYVNLKDVAGVLSASPRIVERPKVLRAITYREMREIGSRGAKVLQQDTVVPLVEAGIPVNVRDFFNVSKGTMVVPSREIGKNEGVICIADEGPSASFNIEMSGMLEAVGFGRDVLEAFSRLGIPYEHTPDGGDNMSVIVNQKKLEEKASVAAVVDYLKHSVQPDKIDVDRNLGRLTLVGEGIRNHSARVSGKLLTALHRASIEVKAFSLGASRISMVAVTDFSNLEEAVRISHKLFIK